MIVSKFFLFLLSELQVNGRTCALINETRAARPVFFFFAVWKSKRELAVVVVAREIGADRLRLFFLPVYFFFSVPYSHGSVKRV